MHDSQESKRVVQQWVEFLQPRRILVVRGDSSRSDVDLDVFPSSGDGDASQYLPEIARPARDEVSIQDLPALDPQRTYDLAYCPDALTDIPLGLAATVLHALRSQCRFVIAEVTRARGLRWTMDPSTWRRSDLAKLPILDRRDKGARSCLLIRGGRDEPADPRIGRVVYLSPNREIRGGVKVLYNHVDILNSIGIHAVLAVRERRNVPASWWAWDPGNLAFSESAATTTTDRDVLVIPEFRFREVAKYLHARCRLLFVQNPGLCFEIDTWRNRGFDGVLTLGCPDGTKSKLQEFLEARTDLPIYPVTNHYSDDPWGTANVPREPGRILCLPRKGPEFVARLRRDFAGVVPVDHASQTRMAVEYARSDVYVHTGFPEGQPMPPIEAMLSGCIVCGFTGLGGLDVMRDGQTAYVAQDGDYEQLARSVRRALSDPNREAVRAAGRRLVQQFHRRVAADELRRCHSHWIPSLDPRPRMAWGRLANRLLRVV